MYIEVYGLLDNRRTNFKLGLDKATDKILKHDLIIE